MKMLYSYPTEVFVTDNGHLAIKQDCIECGHQSVFLLSPDQTKVLYELMPQFMKEQKELWTGIMV